MYLFGAWEVLRELYTYGFQRLGVSQASGNPFIWNKLGTIIRLKCYSNDIDIVDDSNYLRNHPQNKKIQSSSKKFRKKWQRGYTW